MNCPCCHKPMTERKDGAYCQPCRYVCFTIEIDPVILDLMVAPDAIWEAHGLKRPS